MSANQMPERKGAWPRTRSQLGLRSVLWLVVLFAHLHASSISAADRPDSRVRPSSYFEVSGPIVDSEGRDLELGERRREQVWFVSRAVAAGVLFLASLYLVFRLARMTAPENEGEGEGDLREEDPHATSRRSRGPRRHCDVRRDSSESDRHARAPETPTTVYASSPSIVMVPPPLFAQPMPMAMPMVSPAYNPLVFPSLNGFANAMPALPSPAAPAAKSERPARESRRKTARRVRNARRVCPQDRAQHDAKKPDSKSNVVPSPSARKADSSSAAPVAPPADNASTNQPPQITDLHDGASILATQGFELVHPTSTPPSTAAPQDAAARKQSLFKSLVRENRRIRSANEDSTEGTP